MANKNFNNASPPAAGERPGHGASALPDDTPAEPSVNTEGPAVGGATVIVRHTTPYPRYLRAGLLLTKQFKPFEVTAEQLAALKSDTWVEFQKASGPDKT